MNLFTQQNHLLSTFLFLAANTVIAMDLPYPQLQLAALDKKIIIQGEVLINQVDSNWIPPYHPHHNCNRPVEYLTQTFRHPEQLTKLPLRTPFIQVKFVPTTTIIPNGALPKNIRPEIALLIKRSLLESIATILPAQDFINCNDGSEIFITANKQSFGINFECVFRLTCIKNENLVIKQKYFPKDKQGNTFETQFLSCMNQFYAKPICCQNNPNIPELIQNNVLKKEPTDRTDQVLGLLQMIGNPFQDPLSLAILNITYIYKHGIDGCSNPNDLRILATTRTIKPYGSAFNCAMNRQHTPSRIQQKPISAAEAGRIKCYHNYMEHVKHVGNKSPMAKTGESYNNPAPYEPNKIVHAEDTPPYFFPSDDKTKNHIGNECVIL